MTRRGVDAALWASSLVTFSAGFYVGMNVDAEVGALLWLASAGLAFAPFLAHRNPKG